MAGLCQNYWRDAGLKDYVGLSDISLILFIMHGHFFNLFSNVYLSLYASPEFSMYCMKRLLSINESTFNLSGFFIFESGFYVLKVDTCLIQL